MIMRNSFLPPLPSEIFSIGNNDFPPPSLDIPTIVETKMNVHSGCFYPEPKAVHNENLLRGGFLDNNAHYQPNPDNRPVYQYFLPSRDAILPQPTKKLPISESNNDWQPLFNAQKRRLETDEHGSEEEINDLQSNKAASNKRTKNKRKKLNSGEHYQSQANLHPLEVPARKSQKIGDKITALQKLVSPYGKTDTASVLQEASLYIKLLQEQIRNLFQMLSSSYISIRPLQPKEITKTEMDLRSKGLCLVPISYMKEVTKENDLQYM